MVHPCGVSSLMQIPLPLKGRCRLEKRFAFFLGLCSIDSKKRFAFFLDLCSIDSKKCFTFFLVKQARSFRFLLAYIIAGQWKIYNLFWNL